MMSTMTPERIHIGAIEIRFLLEGSATGGAVAVFEFDVPAGARVPAPHSHDGYEETLYGPRGTLTWTVAGDPIAAWPRSPPRPPPPVARRTCRTSSRSCGATGSLRRLLPRERGRGRGSGASP